MTAHVDGLYEDPVEIDFRREGAWWDAKAPNEELDLDDEAVNRSLRWREIERRLDGVHTVLDIGGGTGAFSIPLARRGYAVTHVDLSPAMLAKARRGYAVTHMDLSPAMLAKARRQSDVPDQIRFVRANAVALPVPDRSFDLVLNTDGAVSFCGSFAEQAIKEACRVTLKVLILAVSHQAWLAPVVLSASIHVAGRILPAVNGMFDQGAWHQDQFPENASLARGATQDYFGALKAFLPSQLRTILEKEGMHVVRCGGLGTLSNLCGKETVAQVLKDDVLFQDFLDLCEQFDREVLPDGPGTRQRAGLVAVAMPV